ncbi:MAG TPA: DUF4390 domain-containing protein, partial [Longimicrobiales bacterium]|nr:DUF4390 domain-containing protein [Longimicrobiales bacterium]
MIQRRVVLSAVLCLGSLLPPGHSRAQEAEEDAPVELHVDRRDGSLVVRLGSLLESGDLPGALLSGLPLRVRVVAELWKDRFFDSQEGRAEWRASVLYDPLEHRYRIRTAPQEEEGADPGNHTVATLAAVRSELQRTFSVPLRPESEGTYYYMATVEVETLSLSDLEELQRWLRGELAPAVSGEGNVEGAVGRGVKRLMVRLLGLPVRRIRVRTEAFPFDPGVGAGEASGREGGPPDREPVDTGDIRDDPDARPLRQLQTTVRHLELGIHEVPLPVAAALGDVPREGEAGKRRQGHVVGPAHTGLQHPADPHRNSPIPAQVVDLPGAPQPADPARLDVHDLAGPQLDRVTRHRLRRDRLVEAYR